jgi:hypothetical protein
VKLHALKILLNHIVFDTGQPRHLMIIVCTLTSLLTLGSSFPLGYKYYDNKVPSPTEEVITSFKMSCYNMQILLGILSTII